jgi:hypothetical protein
VHPAAGYKGASDLFIDSNVQLALAAARKVSCAVFMLMEIQADCSVGARMIKIGGLLVAMRSWQTQGGVYML